MNVFPKSPRTLSIFSFLGRTFCTSSLDFFRRGPFLSLCLTTHTGLNTLRLVSAQPQGTPQSQHQQQLHRSFINVAVCFHSRAIFTSGVRRLSFSSCQICDELSSPRQQQQRAATQRLVETGRHGGVANAHLGFK